MTDNKLITEYRPWGYFAVLEEANNFKVKKLLINPFERISLQLHKHRQENWILVEGTAFITIDKNSREYHIGETAFIPKEAVHRIENKKDVPVIIIEVQFGDYLGEDDIVRFEDDYLRT